jgi:hypothetical protein
MSWRLHFYMMSAHLQMACICKDVSFRVSAVICNTFKNYHGNRTLVSLASETGGTCRERPLILSSVGEYLLALLYCGCSCVTCAAIMRSHRNIITLNLPAVLIIMSYVMDKDLLCEGRRGGGGH